MSESVTTDIEDALDFYLFDGDFGEPGDRELSDKIVKGRKNHTCFVCAGEIQKGELHRVSTWIFYNKPATQRCCNSCCVAMVASVNSDYEEDDPLDARYALGSERRKSGRVNNANTQMY
ncbi:hypothetical protein [Brenneria tiliae]|uniref:Uncharacterized protein n=1 Tax=Brenneria tiliae TaxID=2914984 RepID=A0ABT0MRN0_9GAMM|nr:hypothetical protein [Brenneria tiliae]MCL2892508.1 hypothetical protein [Brenneria tiliae]